MITDNDYYLTEQRLCWNEHLFFECYVIFILQKKKKKIALKTKVFDR